MRNIFIIQSPFQLLSAIEAANYFREDDNVLIVCYVPEDKTNQQIRNVLELYKYWVELIEISSPSNFFLRGIKLLCLMKKLINSGFQTDRIFIGEYRSWYMVQFFHNINPKQCFLLDDGNITIELQKKYIPTNKLYGEFSLKVALWEWFLSLILDLNKNKYILINLFTCFDLKPFNPSQLVIRHSFEFARLLSKNKGMDHESIYFFGGNLCELGLLPIRRELKLIEVVREYYQKMNVKMNYIPHRRESQEKIELIQNELKINVIRFIFPAEIEMLGRDVLPFGIASFYSTVLLTLPKICSFVSVDAFKFPLTEIPVKYQAEIGQIYSDYQNTQGIKVLEVL
jgi:hypothetical protein